MHSRFSNTYHYVHAQDTDSFGVMQSVYIPRGGGFEFPTKLYSRAAACRPPIWREEGSPSPSPESPPAPCQRSWAGLAGLSSDQPQLEQHLLVQIIENVAKVSACVGLHHAYVWLLISSYASAPPAGLSRMGSASICIADPPIMFVITPTAIPLGTDEGATDATK